MAVQQSYSSARALLRASADAASTHMSATKLQPPTTLVLERATSEHLINDDRLHRVRMVLGKVEALAAWTNPGACPSRKVGKALGGSDAHVFACNATANPVAQPWRRPHGTAACVPSIYRRMIEGSGADRSQPADSAADGHDRRVATFMKHHRSLGIRHFFVYACDAACGNHSSFWSSDTTVVITPWCTTIGMSMRGQNYMLNECIQRAAAAGYEWVLSADIDELLTFRPGLSLKTLLAHGVSGAPHSPAVPPDVFTFGSRRVWRWPNGTIANNERVECSGRWNEYGKPHVSRNMCTGFDGHRKHLTRANRIWSANLHFVWTDGCRTGTKPAQCSVVNLDASDAWLYHENGLMNPRSGVAGSIGDWRRGLAAYRLSMNATPSEVRGRV